MLLVSVRDRMIDMNLLSPLLKKQIGIVYVDSGKDVFSRGILIDIGKNSVSIRYKNGIQIISLDTIKSVREIKEG